MKKRAIISAGGTGGHLFPAQALAEKLGHWDLLFVAEDLQHNRFFAREQFAFEQISSATFSLKKPLQTMKGAFKICKGIAQSYVLLKRFDPDLVIGFGSFYTLPMLAAACLKRVPIILHEQNSYPGRVNRLFSRYAALTAITFPCTRSYLNIKKQDSVAEVIFPHRKYLRLSRLECFEYFGLQPGLPVLLVFGGSAGAERINKLFMQSVSELGAVQVLHFTGSDGRMQEAKKIYETLHIKACVRGFEPHIDRAMQIADLAIVRAGSATVNELIEYELPALLIPYPFATDNHQEKNAEHFVMEVQGGKMYKEATLEASFLARQIVSLLTQAPTFRHNIDRYKKQRESKEFADLIEECAHGYNFS